jgi:bacterioferritin
MASKELLEMMNQAIAMEIQVSIQYMWQHIQWMGVKHYAVSGKFKEIAISEMKHAESIAERLFFLGELPTTEPTPVNVGKNLKEMLEQNVKDEQKAIDLYKKIIKKADEEGDLTTSEIFRHILVEEEDHLDFFTSILEEI